MGDRQPEAAGLDHKVSVYCSWAGETSDRLHQVLVTPTCTLSEGVLADDATVVSVYNRSTNFITGFATLDIVALDHTDPRLSAFAAGYAEGHQTADEISQFYKNVYEFGDQGPSSVLTKWVEDNDAWTREQAEIHAATSDYWMSVATVLNRFDGMLAGYEEHRMTHHQPERELSVARLPSLSKLDLLWINLDGDLFDLQNAVGELAAVSHACRPRANSSSRTDSREPPCIASARGVRPVGRNGRAVRGFARAGSDNSTAGPMLRCSALVKYAKDEVYFGHATWDSYATAAPRIYKHLTLPRQLNEGTALRTISMSSSPGFISSVDDWFLVAEPKLATTDSHNARHTVLSVIETSLEIQDQNAYKATKVWSVLCWIRAMVANQLATDAPGWAHTFALQASGTYNNQWMVLDVLKAQRATAAATPLPQNTFWVIEEVPGLVHAQDQSEHLNTHGFWSSFNEIYYEVTRKIAGDSDSYSESMRFKIFAELQGSVNSGSQFARLITWNDYQHDSISQSPMEAIMARGDLEKGEYSLAGGGIDAKYATVTGAASGLVSHARAGPTNDDQPPFCWTPEFASTPHVGHPQCFDNKWGMFAPLSVEGLLERRTPHRGGGDTRHSVK